jgi:two-component system LytT family sensor kinase
VSRVTSGSSARRLAWPSPPQPSRAAQEPARALAPADRALLLRIAAGVALANTLLIATMHYLRGHIPYFESVGVGGPANPFWLIVLLELPVWFGWWLLVPALLRAADAFPVAGARRGRHLGLHLLVFLPLSIVVSSALIALGRWPLLGVEPGGFLLHWAAYLVIGFGIQSPNYALTLLGHHGLCRARDLRRKELDEARVEGLLARARLQTLKSQVQPHFLFNALNGISSLIGRDDVRARRLVAELGALLRAAIQLDDEEVTLADELTVLGGYVALQASRYGDRFRFSQQVPACALELLVPRFALQPLVENAVKHGVERRRASVAVRLEARVEAGGLTLVVADDGPGLAAGAREGVGLGNLRERLRVLHGDAQSLRLTNRPEGGAEATIVLPVRRAETRAALAAASG